MSFVYINRLSSEQKYLLLLSKDLNNIKQSFLTTVKWWFLHHSYCFHKGFLWDENSIWTAYFQTFLCYLISLSCIFSRYMINDCLPSLPYGKHIISNGKQNRQTKYLQMFFKFLFQKNWLEKKVKCFILIYGRALTWFQNYFKTCHFNSLTKTQLFTSLSLRSQL